MHPPDLKHLGCSDILLGLQIALWLMILLFLKKTVNLKELLRRIEPRGRAPFNSDRLLRASKYTDFLVFRVMRSPTPCFYRSLILYRIARTMNLTVQVVFGVRQNRRHLEGHAWLIRNDRPFLETGPPATFFQVMFTYPSPDNGCA